jgi:hypothetical protein
MVSSSSGTQDRKRRPGSRNVTNEVRPMRKKVDGEVAYGDIWPRKAETLFLPPEIHDSDRYYGLARDGQSEGGGESASGEGREPNRKLRSSNASMV